jgi:hypothetical protein
MADFGITEVLAIASAATAASGALAAGQAQSRAYSNQGAALNYNATIQRQNAAATYSQTNAAEDQQRAQTKRQLGRQAAAIGQSGVDPASGTSLLVAQDSATQGELDALTTRYKGDLVARGYTNQADLDAAQATEASSNASTARNSSYLLAAGNILQGAGSYYASTSKLDYLKRYGQTPYGGGMG